MAEFIFFDFYPNLMNLYGSYANIVILRRLLERMGHHVSVKEVKLGEDINDISEADFVFMGAGTERRQRAAMRDFIRYEQAIKSAALDDVTMLFVGTAMELLGKDITTMDGETYSGIGLMTFKTVQRKKRILCDVFGHTALYPDFIVGFMNKCGIISGIQTPLLTSLEMGFGNEKEKGAEGLHSKNIFGSELTGPILVKNPRLLETVAAAILSHKGLTVSEEWSADEWAEKSYSVTVQALQSRRDSGS